MSNVKYVDFFIDKRRVDFYNQNGLPISLVYSIDDKEDISKLRGSHSKRMVRLPGTKDIEDLFNEMGNVGVDNKDRLAYLEALIEVNGIPVFKGRAKLDGLIMKGVKYRKRGKEYKVGLFGNNAEWFDRIEGKCLSDYDYGEGVFDIPSIQSGGNALYDGGDMWCYYLHKWKEWNNNSFVEWREHTVGLFIRGIVDRIFQDVGYRVESDFMDSIEFKKYILSIPPKRFYNKKWLDENINVVVQKTTAELLPLSGEVMWDVEVQDGGNNWNAGEFTAPYGGIYNFFAEFEVEWVGVSTSFKNYGEVWINGVFSGYVYDNPFTLVAGDVVSFRVPRPNLFTQVNVLNGRGYVFYRPDWSLGTPVNPAGMMDDKWCSVDFLVGLTEAFGLMWDSDNYSKVVRVEPRDRYEVSDRVLNLFQRIEGFLKDSDVENIDSKWDLSKDGELNLLKGSKSRYEIGWCSNDETVEGIEENEEFKLYDGRYNFDEDRYDDGLVRKENSFFAKTVHINDNKVKGGSSEVVPQFPLTYPNQWTVFSNERETDYDYKPRILYFGGRRNGIDGYVNMEGGVEYDYPMAFMVNYGDVSGRDPSLSFGDVVLSNGDVKRGMLYRFHLRNLVRLNCGKELKDWFCWNELDIMNLDFRVKKLLDGNKWILSKIDGYRPLSNGSTKTVLLADVGLREEDVEDIDSNDLNGLLIEP